MRATPTQPIGIVTFAATAMNDQEGPLLLKCRNREVNHEGRKADGERPARNKADGPRRVHSPGATTRITNDGAGSPGSTGPGKSFATGSSDWR